KAMVIIFGILISVIVAFTAGAIAQFLTRLVFTFDYQKRMRRYGAIWGGISLSMILFFILEEGASGASFISRDTINFIKHHPGQIIGSSFLCFTLLFQILMIFFKINILKLIVLIGTFALAMAFAANDLVNFIGVPLAGYHAYINAMASTSPLEIKMEALTQKVSVNTPVLLFAGIVMVLTLWFSKKAHTVTETEVSLGNQGEGIENFESFGFARLIVRQTYNFFELIKILIPKKIRLFIFNRINPASAKTLHNKSENTAFDLVRASVNLVISSALISFATSLKLPLSTTYVTFMVAMGSSFSDQAWGRESAVYRISGVITVIGGWFLTALIAFSCSFIFANIINYSNIVGVIFLLCLTALVIWKSNHKHNDRQQKKNSYTVLNLKKIKDAGSAKNITFDQIGLYLREIKNNMDTSLECLFLQDLSGLKRQVRSKRKIQEWSNIITANIFKIMRLSKIDSEGINHRYAITTRCLQKIADAHRDILLRSHTHISNHHAGLLPSQVQELREVKKVFCDILNEVELSLTRKQNINYQTVIQFNEKLNYLADELDKTQVKRILDESSKTRLSILYYSIVGDIMTISRENIKLLNIFHDSFD
ncbi:MAG: phosphate:sodium symporter, partial [Bdellovibrionales bacterium RIFOXYB2_FULL_36_6]